MDIFIVQEDRYVTQNVMSIIVPENALDLDIGGV